MPIEIPRPRLEMQTTYNSVFLHFSNTIVFLMSKGCRMSPVYWEKRKEKSLRYIEGKFLYIRKDKHKRFILSVFFLLVQGLYLVFCISSFTFPFLLSPLFLHHLLLNFFLKSFRGGVAGLYTLFWDDNIEKSLCFFFWYLSFMFPLIHLYNIRKKRTK